MIKYPIYLLITILFFSCNQNTGKLSKWEKIKSNDIDYLMQISADTLQCVECNDDSSLVQKKDFFKNYYNQISIIIDKEYTYHVEDLSINGFNKRYRINYKISDKENLICTLLEGDKEEIKFTGVFSIP